MTNTAKKKERTPAENVFIVIVVLIVLSIAAFHFEDNSQPETIESAKDAVAGNTYRWEDNTGLDVGIPTLVYTLRFSSSATECTVRLRYITDTDYDESIGRAQFETRKYIDTGEKFIRAKCSALGFPMIVKSGKELSIRHSGDRLWFAKKVN